MRQVLRVVFPLCVAVIGCEKGADPSEGAPAGSASAGVAEAEIVVPADFEDKAASEISTDNYQKELDELEAAIKKK